MSFAEAGAYDWTPPEGSDNLPVLHITVYSFKCRMKIDFFSLQMAVPVRISFFQFIQKMGKFIARLSRRDGDFFAESASGDFGSIESVSPSVRFIGHASQIIGNGAHRISRSSEPDQLRVMRITFGTAPQHFLGQEAFPPERDQSL